MARRRHLAMLAVAPAVVVGLTTSQTSTGVAANAVQKRPNVVMIVADDMRTDDLRFMPHTRALIGDQGVTFANSFSPYPLCCPARASILLGQYTHNHRVFSNERPYGFSAMDDSSTLATWLYDAGYATTLLGKYLNGYGGTPAPSEESGTSLDYVPPGWTEWRASVGGLPVDHPDKGDPYHYYDTTLSDNGEGFTNYEGRYQTTVLGGLSKQSIEARAASPEPFLLYASYVAPHGGAPRESDDIRFVRNSEGVRVRVGSGPARPKRYWGMFDDLVTAAPGAHWRDPDISDKPEYLRSILPTNGPERRVMLQKTRQRAESLHVLDLQVKRTIDALAAAGELDQTLVVFTSDNGFFLGEQGIRDGKTLPHDPSLRVPLLMRGPGIPAGEVRYDPFMTIDLAPTIASLAEVEPDIPIDGISMLDVARTGDLGWTRPVLTTTGPKGVVRDTDEAGEPLDVEDPGEPDIRWALGIRTDRYLYVDLATKEEELYDMATDPDQYHNLAGDPAHEELLTLMRDQLRAVRACDGSACQAPLPEQLATDPGESILN